MSVLAPPRGLKVPLDADAARLAEMLDRAGIFYTIIDREKEEEQPGYYFVLSGGTPGVQGYNGVTACFYFDKEGRLEQRIELNCE